MSAQLERKESDLVYDTRGLGKRIASALASEEVAAMSMVVFGIAIFFGRQFAEWLFLLAVAFFFYVRSVQRKAGLALRMPKTSNAIDPKEISPGDRKPTSAEGIVYMGNDEDSGEEVWLTDGMARTHMLFMGTTGSGKTEYLVSLVYNALIHGSGLIYVDGKADSSLYGKIYSMARSMGREDDVLVINFQTGAKDIYGAQASKLSNTLNPFAVGSSGMLSELVKGLMATGEKSTWTQQAESFVEALIKPLVYLRDNHGLNLDVNVIRDYFELNKIEDLAWRDPERYPGLAESGALDGIRSYLMNKPGYKKDKFHDQSETTHEQHGYISMQLGRTFNSLSDTYGYIMKTPLAEIDFVDVFLNRRILVVLLPALEKSPTELTNLGRIVVASIKATMAKGLGSAIEGDWAKVITSKPTNSPSPFMCVLDEYGYYAVEGFAVVPAQARSLGFSAIFAGQDLPAFEKASKEEAKSTLANTNTKLCGKLECVDTFKYFQSLAGQGLFTRYGRYETDPGALGPTGFKADNTVNIERMDRVGLESLRGQVSGQWHLFYGNTILKVKSFFANPKNVQQLRVNHFIRVGRPDPEEVAAFTSSSEKFKRAVMADGGMKSFMDVAGSVADLKDVLDAFKQFEGQPALMGAGMVLAHCQHAEAQRASAFTRLTANNFELEDEFAAETIDFAGAVAGDGIADGGIPEGATPWGEPEAAPWEGPADAGSAQVQAVANERVPGLFTDQEVQPILGEVEDPSQEDGIGTGFSGAQLHEDGIASSTAQGPVGEFDQPTFHDDEILGDFGGDFSQPGADFEIAGEEAIAPAAPQRAQLIATNEQGADFAQQMDVFGIEGMPLQIAEATTDADPDALDLPQSEEDVGLGDYEIPQFDEPAAEQGMLSRDAFVSGLAEVERITGASSDEAAMTASIVASDVGTATSYPLSAPSQRPDLSKFTKVAHRVSELLGVEADLID
ncbi:type IV secretory system conjugative DNA transfer family protein [Roseateles asaccharophilus]|uniref:type IV secretory system conjugative DNA transfer family protein n=1 Tax=Roseateles asaccharophilus TaxID=582607 RepID=UPI0038505424